MSKIETKEKRIFYGIWIVAAGFALLFLSSGAGFYSFSIFIKPLEKTFGWSRAAIAMAMSIYLILHGFCSPMIGFLTQRYGPRRIMTFFAVGSGAAFILVSLTQSLLYFYLIYALLAFTTTGIGFIPVSSLLTKWFVRRRGTAFGFTMLGMALGGFIMSPLVGLLNSVYSWRVSYVFLGLLVWCLAIPLALFVIKPNPETLGLLPDGDDPDEDERSKETIGTTRPNLILEEHGWPLLPALHSRAFRWIAATFFLAPFAQGMVLQHHVPLVIEAGISPTTAALALGLTAGMGGLGKLSFGRVSESIPFHYTAAICFSLQSLAVLLLFSIDSIAIAWVYVFLYGFGMGGTIVLLPIVVGNFFGLAAFGTIMGTITLVHGFGSSAGAVISGFLYDYSGSYNYSLFFAGCIYLSAVLAIFMAGSPKPYLNQTKEI